MDTPKITLVSIAKILDQMQTSTQNKMDQIDTKIDHLQIRIGRTETNMERMQKNFENLQSSVDFLIGHAVMREELRPIIREEIDAKLIPMESRILAAIDAMMGKHRTFEEEVLANRYRQDTLMRRVGLIEQTIGLTTSV